MLQYGKAEHYCERCSLVWPNIDERFCKFCLPDINAHGGGPGEPTSAAAVNNLEPERDNSASNPAQQISPAAERKCDKLNDRDFDSLFS
jgi:hypothetical protein